MKTYKPNLIVADNKVYSYDTHVATIEGNNLVTVPYKPYQWNGKTYTKSKTTSKHIAFIARELNLTVIN